jgi:hypothetical protein
MIHGISPRAASAEILRLRRAIVLMAIEAGIIPDVRLTRKPGSDWTNFAPDEIDASLAGIAEKRPDLEVWNL